MQTTTTTSSSSPIEASDRDTLQRTETKFSIPAVLEPSQVDYLLTRDRATPGNISPNRPQLQQHSRNNSLNNPFSTYSNYTTATPQSHASSSIDSCVAPGQFKLPEGYTLPFFLPLKAVPKEVAREQMQQMQQQRQVDATDFALTRNNSDSKQQDFSTFHFVNAASQTVASIYPQVHWNILDTEENDSSPPQHNVKTAEGLYSIRLTPFIDPSIDEEEQADFVRSQGLYFDPIIRTAGPGSQLVIARSMSNFAKLHNYSDLKLKEYYKPVLFKSNVVSRLHGCLKVDANGQWYIKDFNSSSGTFLNHKRICSGGNCKNKEDDQLVDGADHLLHDGDVLQLGMDFKGGRNHKFRCVKVKVELNLSWKIKSRNYKKMGLEKLQTLNTMNMLATATEALEPCSICLDELDPCQGIFISPCGHSWHFNCVRRILLSNYPQFICPNCRATTDLESSMDNLEVEAAKVQPTNTLPIATPGQHMNPFSKNDGISVSLRPHSPLTP